MDDNRPLSPWRRWWPWGLLALIASLAAWYTLDFEDDVDPEFPKVVRPTFGRRPSPAYRLAEPGDTLDRVGIYLTAGAIVVSALSALGQFAHGLQRRRAPSSSPLPPGGGGLGRGGAADRADAGEAPHCARAPLPDPPPQGGRATTLHGAERAARPWLGALAVSAAAFWYSANPGPTFDGWHGWGWRAAFESTSPWALRIGLACAAGAVLAAAVWAWRGRGLRERVRACGATGLAVGVVVLIVLSQFDVPGVEPVGFWRRWAWVGAMTLWAIALCRLAPRSPIRWRRWAVVPVGAAAWFGLVVLGIDLTWYHRPLERLRTVVPGRIYLSAMPTYRGLEIADARHHFKTIINLYPESRLGKSPRLAGELKFAREHGIRYVESPADITLSDAFLDETLSIAQDPAAWPILVHCHASMDRSPAWVGIYRFVVQGRSLREILREIEGHRGYRPKASVTLLYNRVLPPRAPAHYAVDPDAALLRRCAEGTHDPYEDNIKQALAARAANPVANADATSLQPSRDNDALKR